MTRQQAMSASERVTGRRNAPDPTPEPLAALRAAQGRSGLIGSALELVLLNRIERAGLPAPEAQYRFCPSRRWRADFAWRAARVLVEVQGGIWTGGRHARGSGIAAEAEKLSTAAALGWRVLPVTREMIEDGRAVRLIAQALGLEG